VQPGDEFANGTPVVRPTDLTNKFVVKQGLKLIDPKLAIAYKRTNLMGNELLLCVRGSTGVISIASEELKGANVTRGIVPICFKPKILELHFGYYQFISTFIMKQIKEKTYGTALMQINIGDLRKISMRIPSLSEQHKIVIKLNVLSFNVAKLESIYQQKLADLDELKKSILQQAFSGELTKGFAS
jgi:type I restriction enzyme S subunit